MPLIRKRVLEYILAVLIGVAVVAAVILYAEFGPAPWMPSVRWWGLAAMTVLLFWFTLPTYRRHWTRRSFWLNIAWLTTLHIAAWSIVLAKAAVWGLLWFVPPTAVEAALLMVVLHKLGYG